MTAGGGWGGGGFAAPRVATPPPHPAATADLGSAAAAPSAADRSRPPAPPPPPAPPAAPPGTVAVRRIPARVQHGPDPFEPIDGRQQVDIARSSRVGEREIGANRERADRDDRRSLRLRGGDDRAELRVERVHGE